jgi:hypothetical protein
MFIMAWVLPNVPALFNMALNESSNHAELLTT